MPYSKSVYEKAQRRFDERKRNNRYTEDSRREEIYRVIPEFADLDVALAQTMSISIQAVAEKAPDSKEIIRRAMQRNQEIQAQMARLLEEHGYPRDYMDRIYSCPKCRDSGADENGRRCECFSQLLKVAAAEEFNAASNLKLCRFEDFDLSLYPDDDMTPLKKSSRAIMERNLKFCREFAENFSGKGSGILMSGLTGLGKTHLSLSIANEVIQRGCSVMYNSAPEVLSELERESFGRSDKDVMPTITSCDLFILDDLGAEYKSERVQTFLYEILNARLNKDLPTIVNTNIPINSIQSQYPDRIAYSKFSHLSFLLIILEPP